LLGEGGISSPASSHLGCVDGEHPDISKSHRHPRPGDSSDAAGPETRMPDPLVPHEKSISGHQVGICRDLSGFAPTRGPSGGMESKLCMADRSRRCECLVRSRVLSSFRINDRDSRKCRAQRKGRKAWHKIASQILNAPHSIFLCGSTTRHVLLCVPEIEPIPPPKT
jgi:hypothetical protein